MSLVKRLIENLTPAERKNLQAKLDLFDRQHAPTPPDPELNAAYNRGKKLPPMQVAMTDLFNEL
jgi:hypothetical protein